MKDRYVIQFSDPSDKNTGFLCNDSDHGFFIEGKWWKTVEHYLLGSMFPDTPLEEDIRKSSISKARLLSKGKKITTMVDGRPTTVTIYGENGHIRRKENWEMSKRNILETALFHKFSDPKLRLKLLNTGVSQLVSSKSPMTASILMEIRKGFKVKKEVRKDKTLKDVETSLLTEKELSIIEVLDETSSLIMEREGCQQFHVGMLEDAIYSLCKGDDSFFKYKEKIVGNMNWEEIKECLPNLYKLVENVRFKLGNVSKSTLVGIFLKWLREETPSIELKNIHIHLLPYDRSYRMIGKKSLNKGSGKTMPIVLEEEIKEVRALGEKKKKGKVYDSETLFKTVAKMNDKEIEVQQSGNKIVVCGKGIETYSASLLALGGRYNTKIVYTDDKNIMIFKGEIDEGVKENLLRLGGVEVKKDIVFKGQSLKQNRKILENMGGKYSSVKSKVTDVEIIIFPLSRKNEVINHLNSRKEDVIEIILDTCSVFGKVDLDTVRKVVKIYNLEKGTPQPLKGKEIDEEVRKFLSHYKNSAFKVSEESNILEKSLRWITSVTEDSTLATLILLPKKLRKSCLQFLKSVGNDKQLLEKAGGSVVEGFDVSSSASLFFLSPKLRKNSYYDILSKAKITSGPIVSPKIHVDRPKVDPVRVSVRDRPVERSKVDPVRVSVRDRPVDRSKVDPVRVNIRDRPVDRPKVDPVRVNVRDRPVDRPVDRPKVDPVRVSVRDRPVDRPVERPVERPKVDPVRVSVRERPVERPKVDPVRVSVRDRPVDRPKVESDSLQKKKPPGREVSDVTRKAIDRLTERLSVRERLKIKPDREKSSIRPEIETIEPEREDIYTSKMVDSDVKRSVIYMELLESLNLEEEKYDSIVDNLESLSKGDLIKLLNQLAFADNEKKKKLLRI